MHLADVIGRNNMLMLKVCKNLKNFLQTFSKLLQVFATFLFHFIAAFSLVYFTCADSLTERSQETKRHRLVTEGYLSELMVKRLWKLSACECVAVVKVLSSEPSMTPADSHVLQMNRYFFACGQSCTMILLTYLPITPSTHTAVSPVVSLLWFFPNKPRSSQSCHKPQSWTNSIKKLAEVQDTLHCKQC